MVENILEEGLASSQNRFRFSYTARLSEFKGRIDEMSKLQHFLDEPKDFHWWAITGPAICGKSRLALEFSLSTLLRGFAVI